VETRFRIAEMYQARGDRAQQHDQLRRIVALDGDAGFGRTDRTRVLAARSALVLSEALYHEFAAIELVQPFEKSLQEKQRRMDAALEAFGRLVDYEDGEITAAATFYIAELYFELSRALLASERPRDLAPDELAAYETGLDEEAFPFEEKAIEVHEKNLELTASGVYNAWIEKSLAKLAERMPGRYAKPEASSGFLASLDTWVDQPPSAPAPAAPAATPPAIAELPPDAVEGTLGPVETVEVAPDAPATPNAEPAPEPVEVAPPADAAEAQEEPPVDPALGVSDASPR
jgi:tetratricopeptide (TPR) repeat protein